MRQIGTLAGEPESRRLADYLLTRGIKSKVERDATGWQIWVYDEDRVADARQEFAEFTQNPADPRYAAAVSAAQALRAESSRKEAQAAKNVVNVRDRWAEPAQRAWPVTMLLILISIGVAVATNVGKSNGELVGRLLIATEAGGRPQRDGGDPLRRFVDSMTEIGERLAQIIKHGEKPDEGLDLGLKQVREGQVWRLVTPIFLHLSFPHILFNMWMMYGMGPSIERRLGSALYLLMVVLIAVVSNVVQYEYFHLQVQPGGSFGGMSGVLYGLFGYAWMKSKFDPAAGLFISPQNVIIMIGWLFLCMTGWVGPIANGAHVAGLLAGMFLGYAPIFMRKLLRR